jgi:hypothetical protein
MRTNNETRTNYERSQKRTTMEDHNDNSPNKLQTDELAHELTNPKEVQSLLTNYT